MKYARLSIVVSLLVVTLAFTGCFTQEQYEDLQAQNRIQQRTIDELEGQVSALQASKSQMEQQLKTLRGQGDVTKGSLSEEIAALEKAIEEKNSLIAKLQARLLQGGVKLPMELSVMLQDFANQNEMVTYDEGTGMLKFKSDLLFELGSDKVAASAVSSIQALCQIMKNDKAKDFDVIIAGHTDNVPIGKPETRALHPTNWHLSVHRAISVLNLMTTNGVEATRLSVRGFGEYRPIEANQGNKGNPANRRVEMYIVPKGV
jgi:chemotaxis protein MotB